MLDTLATARTLIASGIDPAHADAITVINRQAAEHYLGDYVTRVDLQVMARRSSIVRC